MATPPKIPMFHADFNSNRLIWEKILLRVFLNSAMKKAAAREQLRTLGETSQTANSRQKMPLGGLTAAFSSLDGRKHDYGASRGASESQEKLEKERRSTKSGRKAANRAPNATLNPCSEAPWRRFLPSCEQNRATAASRKEKPAKRYECLAGFRSDALNLLRTQHVYWARKESRTQSAVVCKSILEHPLKHRFDMALRLFH